MSQAYFTTEATADGAIFHVNPVGLIGTAVLVSGIGFLFFVWFASQGGLGTIAADAWAILYSPLALIYWIFAWKRKPFDLVVNRRGVAVGERFFPVEDIREFNIVDPSANAYASSTIVIGGLAGVLHAGVATAGERNAEAMRRVSVSVTMRRKSISKPVTLASGLTYECASALMHDVAYALR
jgi:hypothetical protein